MSISNFFGVRKSNLSPADSHGTVEKKAAGAAELGLNRSTRL
jgi:hypothetical protein